MNPSRRHPKDFSGSANESPNPYKARESRNDGVVCADEGTHTSWEQAFRKVLKETSKNCNRGEITENIGYFLGAGTRTILQRINLESHKNRESSTGVAKTQATNESIDLNRNQKNHINQKPHKSMKKGKKEVRSQVNNPQRTSSNEPEAIPVNPGLPRNSAASQVNNITVNGSVHGDLGYQKTSVPELGLGASQVQFRPFPPSNGKHERTQTPDKRKAKEFSLGID